MPPPDEPGTTSPRPSGERPDSAAQARLTLYAIERMADSSREWARSVREDHPDTHPAQIADDLRTQTAHVARIDGAIAGTPFFVALVPGYLTYLLQEMRMTLRTAALYGRDPGTLRMSAEMLALRGLHPDVDSAEAALNAVRDGGAPDRPVERRSWRTWVHSAYLLLVFGGFMSPSTAADQERGRLSITFARRPGSTGSERWARWWRCRWCSPPPSSPPESRTRRAVRRSAGIRVACRLLSGLRAAGRSQPAARPASASRCGSPGRSRRQVDARCAARGR